MRNFWANIEAKIRKAHRGTVWERMSRWKTLQNQEIFWHPCGVGPSWAQLQENLEHLHGRVEGFQFCFRLRMTFRCFLRQQMSRGRFLPGCIGGTQHAVYLPSFLSPSIYPKANSHFASFLIYWPYFTIMPIFKSSNLILLSMKIASSEHFPFCPFAWTFEGMKARIGDGRTSWTTEGANQSKLP